MFLLAAAAAEKGFLHSILGMPWETAVLILCAIFLLVDIFFFGGDFLTHLVHVAMTLLILHWLPVNNWIWLTLLGLLIYGAILGLHFILWRDVLAWIINHLIAPDKMKTGNEALTGLKGEVRFINGSWVIHVNDEWLQCEVVPSGAAAESENFTGVIVKVAKDKKQLFVERAEK
ncbi:MAG: hypothetical protein J6S54_12630 [Lentisphaeria bacterium]|nr:hypothetical protein [Lentisphaeria bacterium]